MLKHQAMALIENSEVSDEYKNNIKKIYNALKQFESIEQSLVPNDSLLREFLGAEK